MKKRVFKRSLAVFLVLAMCFLWGISADTSAIFVNGQWVIYTITNDAIHPLSYQTMPFMHSSVLYIPYTVFSQHMGFREIYNDRENILILSNGDRTLFFDLDQGIAYDDNSYTYARSALAQNGMIYLPARFTAEYFGLEYVYDAEKAVVRLTDSSAKYSMESILLFYSKTFDALLADYQTLPPPLPDPETSDPVPVYLTFAGALSEETEDILDFLRENGLKATFFLTADTILQHEELVRRIYVDGHTIGLGSASGLPASPEALLSEFQAANAALFRVLRTVSRMVYLPGGSVHEHYDAAYFTALEQAGYQIWDLTIIPNDTSPDAVGGEIADEIIMALITTETEQTLALHSTAAAHDALAPLLDYIHRRSGEIRTADLLTQPVRWDR